MTEPKDDRPASGALPGAALEKELKKLSRKLERSEEQRRLLEVVNDRSQSMLRAIRGQIEESRALIERQNTDLMRLYAELQEEKQVSERLLLNVLPASVAERLKTSTNVIADHYADVTVLFSDLVGFTTLSAQIGPERLVELLDALFSEFDRIADQHGLEKIKTIGDAYMAAAGLPVPCVDHAPRAARAALDMVDALAAYGARHGYTLGLRIGIHTGSVVAGVIGRRKFIYDLWGDTVNTASRMESHGVAGRVQITDATRACLDASIGVEERGVVEVKGKGPLRTWLLTQRDPAKT